MSIVKELLKPMLFYGGLPLAKRTWRRLSCQQRIFILMNHRVQYHAPPFFVATVKPYVFEKQIRFLKKKFYIVDLGDLNRLDFSKKLKKDIVIITFDDGYRDNYTYAFPILKKYQVPATIFLATNYINTERLLWYDQLSWILYKTDFVPDTAAWIKYDLQPEVIKDVKCFFSSNPAKRAAVLHSLAAKLKAFPDREIENTLNKLAKVCKIEVWPGKEDRAMLSWEEVKEMSEHGISFGSHTVSHPVLSTISTSQARKEIVESKRVIEEQIQKPVTTFAYPYGKKEDYTDNTVKILTDEGFEYACSTNVGTEKYPLKNPFELKRRGVALSPYFFF